MFGKKIAAIAAAVAFVSAPVAAQAQEFINILTGGTGGIYYPIGVGLSKIYGANIANSRPSVQSTKASVENLNLLQQGKGEIALTLGDSLAAAWNGDEEAGFKTKLDKLRTIAGVYPNYIQIAASKESGIKTIADLKGKRVSVGAPRSGTEINARAIFAAAGISYKDLGKVEYLPFNESVELMKNRQLDATLQSAGLGVASIRDLANSIDIVIVEVPASLIDKIGAPFQSATIPAGTYKGVDAAVNTAVIPNFLVTRADLSEDLVYQMTKLMFENLGELASAHAAAKQIKLENGPKGSPVPLHPGAAKYYKEKNVAM